MRTDLERLEKVRIYNRRGAGKTTSALHYAADFLEDQEGCPKDAMYITYLSDEAKQNLRRLLSILNRRRTLLLFSPSHLTVESIATGNRVFFVPMSRFEDMARAFRGYIIDDHGELARRWFADKFLRQHKVRVYGGYVEDPPTRYRQLAADYAFKSPLRKRYEEEKKE
jgi:hypothetical protein